MIPPPYPQCEVFNIFSMRYVESCHQKAKVKNDSSACFKSISLSFFYKKYENIQLYREKI